MKGGRQMTVDLRTIRAEARERAHELESQTKELFKKWEESKNTTTWLNWNDADIRLYDFVQENRIKRG